MHNSSPRGAATPLDARHFRNALAQFATGVTIVATRLENGAFIGLTATSFNSVSLTPPLVLWSLAGGARSLPAFEASTHYTISVLAADQTALADRFSRRIEDRFAGVEFDLSASGMPLIRGAAAWFDCRNRRRHVEGDHVIFIGEVEHCAVQAQAPLIFHGGKFATTAR